MVAEIPPIRTVFKGDGPDDHHHSLSELRSQDVLSAETVYRLISVNCAPTTLEINAAPISTTSLIENDFNVVL